MRKLVAVFENSEGKNHRWSFNNPDPNKSAKELNALLEKMTILNLFKKDGVGLFKKLVGAKIVETTETTLFDLSEEKVVSADAAQTQVDETAEEGLSIQINDETEDGVKQLEVVLPRDLDVTVMSDEELLALFSGILPDHAVLEDIYYEEDPGRMEGDSSEKTLLVSDKEAVGKPHNGPPKEAAGTTKKRKINKTKRKLLNRFKQYKQ